MNYQYSGSLKQFPLKTSAVRHVAVTVLRQHGFRSAVQVCITIIIFIRVSLSLSCAKQISLS